MTYIVGITQPFDRKQTFYVDKDNNKIASQKLTIDEIPEALFAWNEEYHVDGVKLLGPKQFNRGIKKRIEAAELTKYSKNTLKIRIM